MEHGYCGPWSRCCRGRVDVSPGCFLERVGLPADGMVFNGCRTAVSSSIIWHPLGIEGEAFAAVCVVVDKHDKIGSEATAKLLAELGVDAETASAILELMAVRGIEQLGDVVASDNTGYTELQELLRLAEAAGIADRITIDCSVVRGLSYYTGTVWECFDASGEVPVPSPAVVAMMPC